MTIHTSAPTFGARNNSIYKKKVYDSPTLPGHKKITLSRDDFIRYEQKRAIGWISIPLMLLGAALGHDLTPEGATNLEAVINPALGGTAGGTAGTIIGAIKGLINGSSADSTVLQVPIKRKKNK